MFRVMKMRSFIAIDIEKKDVVEKIVNIEQLLKKSGAILKLVEPENLHITIRFLGEIDEKDVPILKATIEKNVAQFNPFVISLKGIGAFPTKKNPRVVWIGVEKNRDMVIQIAKKINTDLDKMGFRIDKHEFHPHVTIARVKRFNSTLKSIIQQNKEIEIGDIIVRKVKIKKSTLTPQGPIYTTLEEIPLE